MYDYNTDENDFVINLDIVSKWLKTRKDGLKDTLTQTYMIDIDYKIHKNKRKSGGRPDETILLTPTCFKRLTMLSRTKKAEQVRTYYIQLEKHLDKYKNYIIDGLDKEVNILKNNQKPKLNKKGGVIYIIKSQRDLDGLYRIGKSYFFKSRKFVHDSSHPDDMEIIFIYETKNITEVEDCLKAILKTRQYRRRKEFYEIDIDILKELVEDCDKLTLKVTKNIKNIKKGGNYYLMLKHN